MDPKKRLKRAKKKQDEIRRNALAQQLKRQHLQDLFSDLQLTDIVREARLIDQILNDHPQLPKIRLSTSAAQDQTAHALHAHIKEFLFHARWTPPGLKRSYSAADFWSLVKPVICFLTSPRKKVRDPGEARLTTVAFERCKHLIEAQTILSFESWVATELRHLLVEYSRMDQTVYTLDIVSLPNHNRTGSGWYFELQRTRTDLRQLYLRSEHRWARRCGYPGDNLTLDLVTWNANELDSLGRTGSLPVYVHSHVFDRLCGPTGRLASLDHAEVHDLLYESLRTPRLHVSDKQPGCFLVDYGPENCKLGYIVCEITSKEVIAKTFLFLTMDGTPEGDALYRRLKLSRHDKSYLGLDNLDSLLASDIKDDPTIRALLRECNVDHIFEGLEYMGPVEAGMAAECRYYLKLQNSHNHMKASSPFAGDSGPSTSVNTVGAK